MGEREGASSSFPDREMNYQGDNYYLDDEDDDPTIAGSNAALKKGGDSLPQWGNVQTMNINPLILTNIQGSPYFKVSLAGMKSFNEVVDEIYYKVSHLEPWERGSRVGRLYFFSPTSTSVISFAFSIFFLFSRKLLVRPACAEGSAAWVPAESCPLPTASFSNWEP